MPGIPSSSRVLWTELFDSTLAADAAAIDSGAGGFATSLDHLLILVLARTDEAAVFSTAVLTLNGDAAGNYDRQVHLARNVTASAAVAAAASNLGLPCPGASVAATVFGAHIYFVPAYAQTVAQKVILSLSGWSEDTATEQEMRTTAHRWRSTAAIRCVTVTARAGNLVTGSRLTVYGIG